MDLSKLDMSKPDEIMKATKKGKTVMMFVRVSNVKDQQVRLRIFN